MEKLVNASWGWVGERPRTTHHHRGPWNCTWRPHSQVWHGVWWGRATFNWTTAALKHQTSQYCLRKKSLEDRQVLQQTDEIVLRFVLWGVDRNSQRGILCYSPRVYHGLQTVMKCARVASCPKPFTIITTPCAGSSWLVDTLHRGYETSANSAAQPSNSAVKHLSVVANGVPGAISSNLWACTMPPYCTVSCSKSLAELW